MMGPDSAEGPISSEPAMWGIIPRAISQIFDYIATAPQDVTFSLTVSYLEVYCEIIRDLLDPSKENLTVRESSTDGFFVDGATKSTVKCADDISQAISMGDFAPRYRRDKYECTQLTLPLGFYYGDQADNPRRLHQDISAQSGGSGWLREDQEDGSDG